jgi:Brp/Blh family beta-carotene 15,15'-monooxygenase
MHHYLNLQSKVFLVVAIISLCVAFLVAGSTNMPNFLLLILMIALFGVPHGALDTLFAQQAFELNTIQRWVKFVIIYLILSLLVFTIWLLFPTQFFILFLAFSALHFADDIGHIRPPVLSLLYGINIILLPSILQTNHLSTLYGYLIEQADALILLKLMQPLAIIVAFLTLIILFMKKNQIELHNKIDMLSVSALILLIHPLVAFTIYFCLMHSARHIIRSKFFFSKQSNQRFMFMLLMPTCAVLAFCLFAFANMPANQFDENLIKLTFVTLAALTFPHAFLLKKVGFIKSMN